MADPDNFEHVGSRGFHRPVGVVSFEEAIFAVPSTFGRYAFAVRWAQAAGGALRIGFVSRPEFVDHEKIGMVMARNRGLDADVFTNEADAITWLDARAVVRC